MSAFSPRYDAALILAAQAHQGQLRKGGNGIPYITHVVHVSTILLRHGFPEDVVVAGLLHDVVEDCDVPLAAITDKFGTEVARLVEAVSEQKVDGAGAERPWEDRKAEKLAQLRSGGAEVAALKAADALHNIHSTISDLQHIGPLVWQRFKRGAVPTLWYYGEILAGVQVALADHPLAEELMLAVKELEQLTTQTTNVLQSSQTTQPREAKQ